MIREPYPKTTRGLVLDGPRPVRPEEFERAVALCNEVLRPDSAPTVAQEYPLVLAPENAAHMHILKSGADVVAHAASYSMRMQVDQSTELRIGCINSVATDPLHRKRGFASQLVEACCDDLREQGVHLVVLWTDVEGLYEKLGFWSLGSQLLYRLDASELGSFDTDADIAVATARDREAMARLRADRLPYIERGPEEWRRYMAIPLMSAWVARREGHAEAYVLVGKGADFDGCCHEWAGPTRDVLALLTHAQDALPNERLVVLAPDETGGLNRALQRTGAEHIRMPLGMFRCIDPTGLFECIQERVTTLTGASWAFRQVDDGCQLTVGGEALSPFAVETWCAMVLGPQRPSELISVSPHMGRILDEALPVPMFIWGLDSA